MRPEQIKPGALVYDTNDGLLYRLDEATPLVEWPVTLIGRWGEETIRYRCFTAQQLLWQNFALWCEACDGTGKEPFTEDAILCPECGGEGLIR